MSLNTVSTAKRLFSRLVRKSYAFFLRDGWFVLFYTLLQCLPELFIKRFGLLQWSVNILPFSFLIACLICLVGRLIQRLIGRLWGNVFRKAWHILCHAAVYFIALTEVYLFFEFGLTISYESFLLLLQTNPNEAQEFASAYLLDSTVFCCLFAFLGLAALEFVVLTFRSMFNIFRFRVVTLLCALYAMVGIYTGRRAAMAVFAEDNIKAYGHASRLLGNSFVKIYIGLRTTRENMLIAKDIDRHIGDTRVKSQTKYNGKIVFIIGESHSKLHTSLYGYNKPTYPLLDSMRDSLCVFQDIVTISSGTNIVFREMLSTSSIDDDMPWSHASLFPAVFKSAGWNVVFCSNQIDETPSEDAWNAALDAVLNSPTSSDACFTTRNHTRYDYDAQMVDSFLVNPERNTDPAKPSLYIVHFMGQHVTYGTRFPADKAHFTAADYSDRSDVSEVNRQILADYDNACRYNDEQIHKIFQAFADDDAILIYMSDHGEEVHDFRDHCGRSYDLRENAPQSFHCMFDVPFVIYMTEKYRRNHPEMASLVASSVARPFMTDDICHLLFYLGDVDTGWFDPTRCLIHNDYNARRKRILQTGDDYDEWAR